MKTEGFGVWGSKLRSLFDRYKFVLVVILAGVVLLLLPSFGGEKRGGGAVESSQESGSDPFQVEELERKLVEGLGQEEQKALRRSLETVLENAKHV